MKTVVGLGNPGKEYELTPHNAGFAVIDELAVRLDVKLKRSWRFRARTAKYVNGADRLLLVEPLTFMNRSGEAVSEILRYSRTEATELIVVLDDADLPPGCVRIRARGSSGGHKGLDSIISSLGTGDFTRVRVGIGRGRGKGGLIDYVLSPVRGEGAELFRAGVRGAADAVQRIVEKGVERAMNEFNGIKPEGDRDGESE